jgi:hypothetical protein
MNIQKMSASGNASRKRKDAVAGRRRNVIAKGIQERAAQAHVIPGKARTETNNMAFAGWY